MPHIDAMSINLDRRPYANLPSDTNSANIESLSHHSQQFSLNHNQKYRSNLHKSNTLTPADVKKLASQNFGQRRAVRTASVLRKPKAPPPLKTTNFDDEIVQSNHQMLSLNLDSNSSRLSSTLPRNRTLIPTTKSISPDPAPFTASIAAPGYNYHSQNRSQNHNQHQSQDSNSRLKLLKMTPISSFKRFWKLMSGNISDEKKLSSSTGCSTSDNSKLSISENLHKDNSRLYLSSIGSLGTDSIDNSASPTMCPPLSDQLKSVSYMASANNYSNYDEFTRSRNKLSSTLLNHSHSQRVTTKKHLESYDDDRTGNRECINVANNNNKIQTNVATSCRSQFNNNNNYDSFHQNNNDYSRPKSDLTKLVSDNQADDDAWQLSSLPLTYEKNLSTLYEERQNHSDSINDKTLTSNDFVYGFGTNDLQNVSSNLDEPTLDKKRLLQQHSNGVSDQTDSSQSLNSTNTSDSFIENQRQNAKNFRFSYGQPKSFQQQQQTKVSSNKQANDSKRLSEKLMSISRDIARDTHDNHIYDEAVRVNNLTIPSETQTNNNYVNNSMNINEQISNNNQSVQPQTNMTTLQTYDGLPPRVPGNSDQTRRISQDVSRDMEQNNNNNIVRSNSYRTSLCDNNLMKQKQQFLANGNHLCDRGDILNGAQDNNSDDSHNTTIVSNSSTIRPGSGVDENYACVNTNLNNLNPNTISDITELRKIVDHLKSELEAKKKDINDLQLMKWKSEYMNYELRSTINKLEKENAQLKAIVVNSNGRVHHNSAMLK